jgi:hypothetical protein
MTDTVKSTIKTRCDPDRVRFFYRREPSNKDSPIHRRIVVAYKHNSDTGNTVYGASIFRKTNPKDIFTRKNHRNTAKNRLLKYPVSVIVKSEKLGGVENKIRKLMFTHGVKSKV